MPTNRIVMTARVALFGAARDVGAARTELPTQRPVSATRALALIASMRDARHNEPTDGISGMPHDDRELGPPDERAVTACCHQVTSVRVFDGPCAMIGGR